MKDWQSGLLTFLGLVAIFASIFFFVWFWTSIQYAYYQPYYESLNEKCLELGMKTNMEGFGLSEPMGYCINQTEAVHFRGYNGTWRRLI